MIYASFGICRYLNCVLIRTQNSLFRNNITSKYRLNGIVRKSSEIEAKRIAPQRRIEMTDELPIYLC